MPEPRTHRAQAIVSAVARAYPQAWERAAHMRGLRGRELPEWPDWCYLPLAGAYAIVSGGGERRVPLDRAHHVGIVGALAAWRMTQGIYRYDPVLYEALASTPIDGDLPCDPLYRLPEWCVYVETPDLAWGDVGGERRIHGAWIHLEAAEGQPDELRLVLDTAVDLADPLDPYTGLVPIPIILGEGGIAEGLERVIASGVRQALAHGMESPIASRDDARAAAGALAPIVSLALYLCAEEREIDGQGQPGNPAPRHTRHGTRGFPAAGPRTWDVGLRIGAALRMAYQARETAQAPADGAGGTSPRPHIRRAHWHGFWRGPRRDPSSRRLALRWLPPIAVNVDGPGDLPGVVHRLAE